MEFVADSFVDEDGGNGRVDVARERQNHMDPPISSRSFATTLLMNDSIIQSTTAMAFEILVEELKGMSVPFGVQLRDGIEVRRVCATR